MRRRRLGTVRRKALGRTLGMESLEPRVVLDASVAGGVVAGGINAYADFLQVSEIMYNPPDPSASEVSAGFSDNDDFEFMELYNSSDSVTLDLNNVRIADVFAVDFSFTGSAVTSLAPESYVLLVKNLNAFRERYGTGLDSLIAGTYVGSLNNGGEGIRVLDPGDQEIHNFAYSDNHPWPVTPDGHGFSLNLLDPDSNPDHEDDDSWTGESPVNGSPGAANATSVPTIILNEVLAHTDAPLVDQIELYNPTGSPVDVGGWYLSDDSDQPQLYAIPAGSMISQNGYLVLAEDNDADPLTNPGPNYFGSQFSLSAVGEELYLFSGDGSALTGYDESIRFGASLNGESMGRWPNGEGRIFPMVINTLGSANSQIRIGDVVITEIMYNAPDPGGGVDPNLLEFLEIQNTSNETLDLSTWEVNGIGYEFPAGVMIGPGEVRVLLPFDPATDAAAVTAFNAIYSVDIAADPQTYLGPYPGALSGGGERITVFSIDEPPAGSMVKPLIFEDEADYDDAAPWPTGADGGGDSLHRLSPSQFGSLAEAWSSTIPSPGEHSFGTLLGDLDTDGDIDFDDIDAFVLGLVNATQYEAQFGVSPVLHGDMDQDGLFDFDDIPGFVDVLTGQLAAAADAEPTDRLPLAPLSPAHRPAASATGQRARTGPLATPSLADPDARDRSLARTSQTSADRFRTIRWSASPDEIDAVWTVDEAD